MWLVLLVLLLLGIPAVFFITRLADRKPARSLEFQGFSFHKATKNLPERRHNARTPCNQEALCRDLTRRVLRGIPFQVRMVNTSATGCQIVSKVGLPTPTLVFLKVPSRDQQYRVAFVAYCRNASMGYQSGLQYVPERPSAVRFA